MIGKELCEMSMRKQTQSAQQFRTIGDLRLTSQVANGAF